MTHLEITLLEELRKADRVISILKANILLTPQEEQRRIERDLQDSGLHLSDGSRQEALRVAHSKLY